MASALIRSTANNILQFPIFIEKTFFFSSQLESPSPGKSLVEVPVVAVTTQAVEEGEKLSPDVEAFERAFQKIQNDYVRAVGSGMSDEDYKGRMKVLGRL